MNLGAPQQLKGADSIRASSRAAATDVSSYRMFRPQVVPNVAKLEPQTIYRPIQYAQVSAPLAPENTVIVTLVPEQEEKNAVLANTLTTSASSVSENVPPKTAPSAAQSLKLEKIEKTPQSNGVLPPLIEENTLTGGNLPNEFLAKKAPKSAVPSELLLLSKKKPIISPPIKEANRANPVAPVAVEEKKSRASTQTTSRIVTGLIAFFVTFIALFVLLTLLNPIFVQKTVNEHLSIDQKPNLVKVAGFSIAGGALAAALPYIWRKINEKY